MLNRNGLKCIQLPSGYLKNTEGERSANINNFIISGTYYTSYKVSNTYNFYMGVFNNEQILNVDTFSLDGEIIVPRGNATISYLHDDSMDATDIITLTRTITNKTSENYIINTIGILMCVNPNTDKFALMSCERIPTVTIKPSETYTFTHKIKIA